MYYKKYKKLLIENNILQKKNEEEKERLDKLFKLYQEAEDEIKKSKDVINNLKSDRVDDQFKINELKNILTKNNKLISELKERLGDLESDWHVEAGIAYRYHPITKKLEKYKVPRYFDIDNVYNKDFNEETQMIKFNYKEDNRSTFGENFEIPISLYTYMGGKLFSNSEMKEDDKYYYVTIDDYKKNIVEKGGNIRGKYTNSMLQFLIEKQENIFTAKEFCEKCNIKNRQTGNYYLKNLDNWDLIEKVKKGVYKRKKL